jgi:hypothetical protein
VTRFLVGMSLSFGKGAVAGGKTAQGRITGPGRCGTRVMYCAKVTPYLIATGFAESGLAERQLKGGSGERNYLMTRHGYVSRRVRGDKCTSIEGSLKGHSEMRADDMSCDQGLASTSVSIFSKQDQQMAVFSPPDMGQES